MTGRMTLLVEGDSDQRAIAQLIRRYLDLDFDDELPIEIDPISVIADPILDGLGQRQRVERFHEFADEHKEAGSKILSLTDREFREYGEEMGEDFLQDHYVEGGRFWTRGHSIENYLFDIDILREFAGIHCPSEGWSLGVDLLDRSFSGLLRSLTSLTRVGILIGDLGQVKSSLGPECFEAMGSEVFFSPLGWESQMRKSRREDSFIQQCLNLYGHSSERSHVLRPEFMRWYCHGHLGLKFFLAALDYCMAQNVEDTAAVKRLSRLPSESRFLILVDIWARRSKMNRNIYPRALLERSVSGISTSR